MKPRISSGMGFFFAAGIFFATASFAIASTGFLTSPLVMSPENPKDGDTVTLSALFHNAEDTTITGTIIFYDGNILLASKAATIPPGQVITVSTSFTITAGSHNFSATMNTPTEAMSSGGVEVVPLAADTVSLPTDFVPAKASLAAQASDALNLASEQPILNQIDKAETSVLAAIPPATKNSVASLVANVDSWRASNADNFSAQHDAAQKTVNTKIPDPHAPSAGSGSVLATTQTSQALPVDEISEAGPMTYVALIFFGALTFLFANAIIFYVVGIFLAFIILRFIYRKIAKGLRRNKRVSPQRT